jgi:hypothetical protein
MSVACYAPLDEALDQLSGCGPQLANGNFNHAPMVAEALCALGRPDSVLPWLERYRPRLLPRPAMGEPIRPAEWRAALGKRESFSAWSAFFAGALLASAWPEVLDLWAGRLAPGFSAAATHGPIRVGHAVRALTAGNSPPRLRELADALASWAASYSELPTAAGAANGTMAPDAALARVPVIPPEARGSGNIAAALGRLGDVPDFASAIGSVDLGGEFDALAARLTELFARVYLANVRDRLTAIVFVHGVTSLAAIGHIAPYVGAATGRSLLRHGWQAGCGLYACFGGAGFAAEVRPSEVGEQVLIDRAIANGDEHVIKFAEACRHRHALAASPAYPAAIANVVTMLRRG